MRTKAKNLTPYAVIARNLKRIASCRKAIRGVLDDPNVVCYKDTCGDTIDTIITPEQAERKLLEEALGYCVNENWHVTLRTKAESEAFEKWACDAFVRCYENRIAYMKKYGRRL